MNDYLPKPIRATQLADALQIWLNRPAHDAVKGTASQAPPESKPVFNQEDLLDRLMGDNDLAARLITGFLHDIPRQLAALKERLDAGDARGALLQAHTLKGASAAVSAQALSAVSLEAQEAAAAGDLNRVLALLPRLEEEAKRLSSALKQSVWSSRGKE
jgi:HPt (histidine-containing phosphotransfer) domain-containing protein